MDFLYMLLLLVYYYFLRRKTDFFIFFYDFLSVCIYTFQNIVIAHSEYLII